MTWRWVWIEGALHWHDWTGLPDLGDVPGFDNESSTAHDSTGRKSIVVVDDEVFVRSFVVRSRRGADGC